MGFWNCGANAGGVKSHHATIHRIAMRQGLGIIFIGDTGLDDHSEYGGWLARSAGFRWYGTNRPPMFAPGGKRRQPTGVGFIVIDNTLIVRKIHEDKKGIVALHVQRKGSKAAPIALIGVYNPCAASYLNTGKEPWSEAIMATLAGYYQQLQKEYATVLIGGDFNMRAGAFKYPHAPHAAADSVGDDDDEVCGEDEDAADASAAPPAAAGVASDPAAAVAAKKRHWYTRRTVDTQFAPGGAARMYAFHKFMQATGTCPVFGDRGQAVAGFGTSRPPHDSMPVEGTGAESDTVLYKVGTTPDRVRALPNVHLWAEMANGLTHLPVAVEVHSHPPPPRAAAADAGNGGRGRTVPQVESAVYREGTGWDAMASRLKECFASLQQQQAAGTSIDDAYASLVAGIRQAAADTLSGQDAADSEAASAVAAGPAAPAAPVAAAAAHPAAANGGAPRGNGERQQRRRTLRDFRRVGRVPAEQQKLLDTCRRLRRQLLAGDLSSSEREAIKQQRKTASRAMRQWSRQRNGDALAAAQQLIVEDRVRDPSRMWRELQRISPVDPDCFASTESIPDKAGELPALQRFYRHQRNLAKEMRGGAPCPGVTTYRSHLAVETTAGAGVMLTNPMTAWEVLVALFPMHEDVVAAHPLGCLHPGCGPNCKLWREFAPRVAAARHDDPDLPMPVWKPSVATARAAGCDGLRVETLRFARPLDEGSRLAFRLVLCAGLAAMFNSWLAAGRVPTTADFRRQIVTPIFKPGADADPCDPDFYRGISIGNVIPKVFALVLLSRMSHWAVNNGLVSPEQVGFMPMHSADMHVMTLREVLQMRRAKGEDTFALFVDFKKAYDEVHLPSLWHILLHAGVPASLVGMLREWDTSRVAAVRVNSELSEDFPTDKGVPQGEVMSPLLFNIYIESLSRYLKSMPGFRGVTVTSRNALAAASSRARAEGSPTSFHLTHLLYADDLVILAESVSQLQLVAEAVDAWCSSFHLRMGLSRGKTEAMAFLAARKKLPPKAPKAQVAAARAADAALPPLSLSGGRSIAWTAEYKYLGFPLLCDLSTKAHMARYKGKLESLYGRFFKYNRAVQRLPAAFQGQIATTMLSGAVSYLMAVLPLGEARMRTLDCTMRAVVRQALRCPKNAPTALVEAERRTLPFYFLVVKHHVRLLFYLRHTPFRDGVAVRLLDFMERGNPPAARGQVGNWFKWTQDCLEKETTSAGTALGRAAPRVSANAPAPVVHSLRDISVQLAVMTRAMAFSKWQREYAKGGHCPRPATSADVPRAFPPLDHAADLLGGSLLPHWRTLGDAAFATPLSSIGPGCASILGLSTLPVRLTVAIMRLRLGQQAFTVYPFNGTYDRLAPAPDDAVIDGDSGSDSDGEDARQEELLAAVMTHRTAVTLMTVTAACAVARARASGRARVRGQAPAWRCLDDAAGRRG